MDASIYLIVTVILMGDIEWKDFQIGGQEGVFSVKSSVSEIDKKNLNKEIGSIPYVTRTDLNNGISMYVTNKQDDKYLTNDGNVISIGLDTQTVFYQPVRFYTGQNVQILAHDRMNENIARFLIPLLKIQLKKFNWGGNGATLKRLNNSRIMLPITNNQINWDYMEMVGKNTYSSQQNQIINYILDKYQTLNKESICFKNIELENVDWVPYKLKDFFDYKRGNQKNMASLSEGGIPLVSARKFDNGYKSFVDTDTNLYKGHIITLNNDGDGGAGIAYYQPYKMALDTHVTALIPKDYKSRYELLFISRAITHQGAKFGNNYPINIDRLKAIKIMLPVNNKKHPDWEYMGNYMKKIEYNQLSRLIDYLN